MSNFSMDSINQIRESLEEIYINDEKGNAIATKYGFNDMQLKIIDEMIVHALRLYHFYATGEKVLESGSQKDS